MTVTTFTHLEALTRFGSALSDATRAQILIALRQGPAYPADLAESLGVSRQVMSNQLACLRGCGLVTATRQGRRHRYDLADPVLAAAVDNLLGVVLTVDPTCCAPEGCACA